VWLAQVYTAMDRLDLSFDCLYAALDQLGEHEMYYFLLGKNHELLEEWAQAQECYQKVLRLAPDFSEAQMHLELVEAKLKEA
jgi:tetratricopeptide (TPR) repeat protein